MEEIAGDMCCEEHPRLEWPHDDCPGPGMHWIDGLAALATRLDAVLEENERLIAERNESSRIALAWMKDYDQLRAENEALQTALVFADQRTINARAENERLRAALEAVWASGKVATEGSCYPKELCEDCLLERQVMAALAASPEQEGQ